MTKSTSNIGPKAIKAAIGIALLVVVIMVVLNYWGTYRASKDPGAAGETTASVEATASGESTASPEGGEATVTPAADAEPSQGTVVVLIDGLNFRTGASKSSDLIAGLDKDTKLAYLATEDGWYKVRTSDGKTGYVSSSAQYTELQK